MNYYEVAPNKLIRTDSDTFTYCSKEKLQLGKVVLVEIGQKKYNGIIIKETDKPNYKTKPITSIIEERCIPNQLVKLAVWMSKYYITPLSGIIQTILPSGVQKKRRSTISPTKVAKRKRTNYLFNDEQSVVINKLSKYKEGTFLLHGVTGSGKTDIYINEAKNSIQAGKSAIILVPEIALTSQVIAEFSNYFSKILVTHSKMTESQRHQVWNEALYSTEPRVVIGPRSALFLPLNNVGVIIVDEAHEPSYKQDQSPKYSTLRVASMLGRFHKAKVIFGSATPNILDYYLANQSANPILKLTKPAREQCSSPKINLIDMKNKMYFKNHHFLSDVMINKIKETLEKNKQVLIFHNRRGSTNLTICKNCGWVAECEKCFLPMSLHIDKHCLMCHVCGNKKNIPTSCPKCQDANIINKGIGTKLIELELKKIFPAANIARFDSDNKEIESVNSRYDELYSGKINIAIGTQVVAKGLDLPNLRMVGVVQADSGLTLPDYNSNERIFQLITQVIGRVGRNKQKTQVVVQAYNTSHTSILYALTQNYEQFYIDTLSERKRTKFPPYSHLLKITCAYKTEISAIKNAQELVKDIKKKMNRDITILGPAPAFYERQYGKYHWQIILKSPKREYLIDILKQIPKKNWQFDLDPSSLL